MTDKPQPAAPEWLRSVIEPVVCTDTGARGDVWDYAAVQQILLTALERYEAERPSVSQGTTLTEQPRRPWAGVSDNDRWNFICWLNQQTGKDFLNALPAAMLDSLWMIFYRAFEGADPE